MAVTSSPVPIDYTSRDFAGLRESLLAYAATVAPDWKAAADGDPNDLGVVILELLAYEGDILSYYADRVANEGTLTTATQRSSVLAQAALLDYTPPSPTAATVQLAFTVSTPVPIIIPAGYQVSTVQSGDDTPVIFEVDTDTMVVPPGGTVTITATEGVTVSDEIVATSCGDLDEFYTLAQAPVVADSLIIRVVEDPTTNGNVWQLVSNLLDAGAQDNVYTVSLDDNDALTVAFGDGVNGRVPPRGAVIHATYRVGGGSDGNVPVGTVTDPGGGVPIQYPNDTWDPTHLYSIGNVVIRYGVSYASLINSNLNHDPATDDGTHWDSSGVPANADQPTITVTNPVAASGGTDSQSIADIKANAPRALSARNRAVTLADYEALALQVPGVAKAKAEAVVWTNVLLFIAPPAGLVQPPQTTFNAVKQFFTDKLLPGAVVTPQGPTYQQVDVSVVVQVNPRYAQYVVKGNVETALQSFLDFSNVQFGARLALSDVYSTLANVGGVDSLEVSVFTKTGGTGAADVVLNVNELPIVGNINIFASGGVVNTDVSNDIIGTGSIGGVTAPGAPGAPVVDLLRYDPTTVHLQVHWEPGSNNTQWYMVINYYDTMSEIVTSTTQGPFDSSDPVDGFGNVYNHSGGTDTPKIGSGRAVSIGFSIQAFNGSTGPVNGPETTMAYSE